MKFLGCVIFLVALLMTALLADCNAGPPYRRLPFNGSMYGKRAPSPLPIDYDTGTKSLSALCEMATEVCSAWFPQQVENN